MSSLHAQLFDCSDNECDKISKLNAKLDLVSEDYQSALRLPTLFGSHIWRTIKPVGDTTVINEHFFRRIAKLTPCWLLYTDQESFIAELKEMVGYCVKEYELSPCT